MDFKQLNYFIAVYKTANFTAAARQLHISQQGLSKSIHNLEKELELPLFFREKNHLGPTAFGDLFYKQAVYLTEEFQNAMAILENAKKAASRLKIGFSASVLNALDDIEVSIQRFRKSHPEVLIEMSNETDYACEERIEKGSLDIAFSMGPFSSPLIQADFLMEESIYALPPHSHRLAAKERLFIADLREEPLLTSDLKNKGHVLLKEDFQKQGASPHVVFWSNDPQTHFRLAQKNLGVSLAPEHTLSLLNPECPLKALPIADIQKRKIYVIYKKNNRANPLFKSFLKFIL